jgi:hypothetical protein
MLRRVMRLNLLYHEPGAAVAEAVGGQPGMVTAVAVQGAVVPRRPLGEAAAVGGEEAEAGDKRASATSGAAVITPRAAAERLGFAARSTRGYQSRR